MQKTWIVAGIAVVVAGAIWFAFLAPASQTNFPEPDATSAKVTTFLGGSATGLNFTVNPRVLVSDSRCPLDVQCIWAGTVEVRTAVSTEVAHGEHVFTLGEPREVGDFSVTLVEVTPAPLAGQAIPESSYRFTFEIKKQ